MGLLTADFPHPNTTSLAQIVLEGLGQLKSELNARTQISQNEQENWLAQGKLGASNLLMMNNAFSDQRDAAARDKQNAFNNELNATKLGIEQNNAKYLNAYHQAEADKINWQMKQPDNPPDAPPGTILNPDSPPGTAPYTSGQDIGGSPSLGAPPAGMASPGQASQSQPAGNSLLPPVAGAPLLTPAVSPQIMSEDLAAGAVAGANSAMAANAAGAVPGLLTPQTSGAATPGLLMQTPAPSAPAVASAPPPAPSSSTPWITKDGGVDLTKIPYNKEVQLGPRNIVQRQKVGEVDQLQYYKKVEEVQRNGLKKLVTVPDGMPKLIMPDAVSKEPLSVMLPKDKVKAFETAKFFLDKQFPKMDAKDRQANMKQAGEMQSVMLDLAKDPEVQAHLRKIDDADYAAPPGFRVDGLHYDPKTERMVPTLKRDTPDELKAATNQRAMLRSMWDDYKNIKTQMEGLEGTRLAKAKAKANGLLDSILKIDPLFSQRITGTAPGQPGAPNPTASPTSQNPGFFYGQ